MLSLKHIPTLLFIIGAVYVIRSFDNETSDNQVQLFNTLGAQINPITVNICETAVPNYNFSSKEREALNIFTKFLKNFRSSNPLLEYASEPKKSPEFSPQYLKGLLIYGAYGGSFAVIALLIMFFLCCDCRLCRLWMGPPTYERKNSCTVCSFFILLITTALSIGGFIFTLRSNEGYHSTMCAGAYFLSSIGDGNLTESWIGLSPAISNLSAIKDSLANTVNTFHDIDSDTEPIDENYNAVTEAIEDLYENNKDKNVSSPLVDFPGFTPDFIMVDLSYLFAKILAYRST